MKGKGKTLIKCLSMMLLVPLLIASLARPTSAQYEKILVTATGVPGVLNPFYGFRDIEMLRNFMPVLYEPLILSLINGSLVPWLAKSWEILDNRTRYVFHIDERAKWNDGTPFTAHDVEFTWRLQLRMQNWTEPPPETNLRKVTAVGDYTVEFKTQWPEPLWHLNIGGFIAVPEHIWSQIEDPMSENFLYAPEKHISTSAFKYDSYKEGEWFFFKTREDYWKTESKPRIDGILYRVITDVTTMSAAFFNGEIDVMNIGIDLLPDFMGQPNVEIWMFPIPSATEYLAINTRLYPLNLKEVRKAIDLAIDKVRIAQDYFWGYGIPGNRSLVNFGLMPEAYVPEAAWPGLGKTHEENVAEANRILDELGFTRGPDGIRVTPNGTRLSFTYLLQAMFTYRINAADEITNNLKEIGIEVTVQAPSMFEFFFMVFLASEKTFGFAQGTYGEYPEPWYCQVYNAIQTPYPIGLSLILATGWSNSTADDYARACVRSQTYEELCANLRELNKIFAEELPTICIGFYQMSIYAYRTDKLTNWDWEACTKTGAFGYPLAIRPLTVNKLTPIGWTPTPTPTPTPSPGVTPTPTPTPAPAPTIPTEQIILIVVAIIIIAIIAYIAIKARKKPKT